MPRTLGPIREYVLSRLIIDPSGCLLWTGSITYNGYGRAGGSYVHRLMYEWFVGPIPRGLQIDHLCRVRNCASPAHLEPVTQAENMRRGHGGAWHNRQKTHCPKGHPYDEVNTYRRPIGDRRCKACTLAYQQRWRARRKVRGDG